MNDESLMPFGIHQGEKMANVPANYLIWLYDNRKCYGEVAIYIKENMDVLKAEIELKNKR